MKKQVRKLLIAGMAAGLSLAAGFTAYAGQWKHDGIGWWYENDGGSYCAGEWRWIDGNRDGIAECYYFDAAGYMAGDTVVDGYTVNVDGAWTVDGVVQTRSVQNEARPKAELDDFDDEEVKDSFDDEAVEEAEEALRQAGMDSYDWDNDSERKEALFDYFEALGFDTKNLTIKKRGMNYHSKIHGSSGDGVLSTGEERDVKWETDPFYDFLMADHEAVWDWSYNYIYAMYTNVRDEDGSIRQKRLQIAGKEDENEDGYASNLIDAVHASLGY